MHDLIDRRTFPNANSERTNKWTKHLRPVFCQTNMSDRNLVVIDTSLEDMDACLKSNCTDLDGLSFFMKT